MKIKDIEDFTLEKCQEYLNLNSNGLERLAVEARMSTILKQNKNAYICVKGNKRRVYNTAKKKMVIDVAYEQRRYNARWDS